MEPKPLTAGEIMVETVVEGARLTKHTLAALEWLAQAPTPRRNFNAGVARKLEAEEWVVCDFRPSPFATGQGKLIQFLSINQYGRRRLVAEQLRRAKAAEM